MNVKQAETKTRPRRRRKKNQPKGFWGFLREYLRNLQNDLIAGLLVWVPLIISLWVAWWFVETVGLGIENGAEQLIGWFNELGSRQTRLGFLSIFEYRRGVGVLLVLLLFLSTGFLARYYLTKKVIQAGENLLGRIPLISRIYRAVQQIRDVFVGRDGAVFQEVVMVEFPRPGVRAIGFVTQREQGLVQECAGEHLTAVFVPTTPNPTSGFLLYFLSEQVHKLPITVEDAMKLIISGGAYLPEAHDFLEIDDDDEEDENDSDEVSAEELRERP